MASTLTRENFPKSGNDKLTHKNNFQLLSVLAVATGTQ